MKMGINNYLVDSGTSWEALERFLAGKGEIQLQKLGGASISIFMLLVNFSTYDFRLSLDGELFSRCELAPHVEKALEADPSATLRCTDGEDKLTEVCCNEGVVIYD